MPNIYKISIEGFVSIIEKLKYKFDRPGLNLIIGENGAGKTTIFNALAYGLFGQTLKQKSSVLPWPKITLDSNYRGLHIAIQVDEYIIHRCVDFKGKVLGKMGKNRLVIEKGGEEVSHLRGKVDAQRFINEYLGYTFQLFKTSILFAQELNSLIEEDGPTKKRTFDEAFASAFIGKAREVAEIKLKNLTDEEKEGQNSYNHNTALRDKCKEVLKSLMEANRTFAIEKATSIRKLREKVREEKKMRGGKGTKKGLLEKRKRINRWIQDNEKSREVLGQMVNPRLRDEEFQLMLDVNRYQSEIENLKKKQQLIKDQKDVRCSECGEKLKGKNLSKHKEHKAAKYTELKNQEREVEKSLIYARNRHELTQKQLEEQEDSIKQLEETRLNILGLKKDLQDVKDLLADWQISSNRIRSLKEEISRIRKNVKKNDTSKVEQDIIDLTKILFDLDMKLGEITKKADLQRWLIKDPLSNSGLKAYIFDSMLRRVNHFLKHYTQFIGFQVRVGINLESSNKDFIVSILKNGEEVPYEDLSKGQKQLVKVAICFAMNKTLQSGKPLNILIMDELFESLDPKNVEVISNIVQNEATNKSVHLITHHTLFNPPNCYKIYIAQNAKGQTVIEQKYKEA